MSDVGNPPEQSPQLVAPGCWAQNRIGPIPSTWQREDTQSPLDLQGRELGREQGFVGVAVQQDRLTVPIGQPLGQRSDRGDADTGPDQEQSRSGPGPAAEPTVGPFDQDTSAGPEMGHPGAAVTHGLGRDSQASAVGGGGQRVRVGAGPTRSVEKADVEELPGSHGHPIDPMTAQVDRDDVSGLADHRGDPQPVPQAPRQR